MNQLNNQKNENEENFYDLSQTLIERRKRLHELATEINQWEDESLQSNQVKQVTQNTPKQYKWSGKENNAFITKATNNDSNAIKKILTKQNYDIEKEITTNVKNIMSKFQNLSQQIYSNDQIQNENLTPKSIIQKFEQMSKETNKQQKLNKITDSTSSVNKSDLTPVITKSKKLDESSIINTENIKPKSIIEKFESIAKSNTNKNSNYSSSLTYVSSLQSNTSQDEDEYQKSEFIDEETYEEIPAKNFEETSLFEEITDEMVETYSLSASDYTGSVMNQEEFEEDEDLGDYEDEYDSLDEQNEIVNEITIQKSPDKLPYSTYSSDLSNIPLTDVCSSSASSDLQPFSIQEYRKQKQKSVRRTSIMPRKEKKLAHKSPLSEESSGSKKFKYGERIKELEDLIKNEDNIIHQTGIALERCINDFTATNEHIECNRILLISCQKRQAYSSEINRLKHLINTDIQDHNESNDLTGLLIFSDLQLPIKESYLTKLKTGEEKRIFYFLCLIRNGIQVLQTQVINVQELITNKDTCLIFPNRMAINNVDINFKVKIDIYTLEVLPNNNNKVKHTSSNAKFFSPFKFHYQSNQNYSTGFINDQTNQKAKTSNFIHIDTIEIKQEDILKNKFKLNISSSSIPLSGVLYVNVRCMPSKSIELKGFMSVFEDSNCGFGTWDRRWCFLNNYNISYWKYPDDEYRNGPLGVINLTKCWNEKVSILPRDLCARKYSLELLIQEDSNDELKRFRLSADSKDQANDWLTNINFALANLRLWNSKSTKK